MRPGVLKTLLFLTIFGVLGFFHIYFRMQCVESDYALNTVRNKTKKVSLVNKELKAEKAQLLSVKNLRSYAQRYKLKVPNREQIIVIQD